ncbi:transposase [Tetragenococcus halophilus]|uniref:transposase n=1 Tax=Tetragenococcus halophilus TaxID=51669 RepID=UPI001CA51BEE
MTQIVSYFPKYRTGRPPKSNRTMFNAILWIARNGAPWFELPKEHGSRKLFTATFVYDVTASC